MEDVELAERLIAAGEAERKQLLRKHDAAAAVPLAQALKDICRNSWNAEPARVVVAAEVLQLLANNSDEREIQAHAAWGLGIAALTKGQMEPAIAHLDQAAGAFQQINQPYPAASTQISKLMALAILGRYDEAIECGLAAHTVFIEGNYVLEASQIEHNIGNIYWRRDRYGEAEYYLSAAREHYLSVKAEKQLAGLEYCLAYIKFLKHDFTAAEELYALAWQNAEKTNEIITQADVEVGLGTLALVRGQFDRALDLLEKARRRYLDLGMPYQSAITEQEMADAYLELNLIPEAIELYERLEPNLARLGARGERARALEYWGRALLLSGQTEKARQRLGQARELYAAENNSVGVAMVTLTEGRVHYARQDFALAAQAACQARQPLAAAGAWRRLLMARWLEGEARRAGGDNTTAQALLEATLKDAEDQEDPQTTYLCCTALGLLNNSLGRSKSAEKSFLRALHIIEELRAPLPAEEFRAAFFADKLTPYQELAKLCLKRNRIPEALQFVEKARARALAEQFSSRPVVARSKPDEFEMQAQRRLESLREELNWYYSRLNHPQPAEIPSLAAWQQAALECEREISAIKRQLEQRGQSLNRNSEQLDLTELQKSLGADKALVEYALFDGKWLAFVMTNESLVAVRELGTEADLQETLAQFIFQLGALRHGAAQMRPHLPQLTERAKRYLAALYDLLLRPLAKHFGTRRLVIVPHGALNYVPFHALHDGMAYVIEQREVSYAPSATIYCRCAARVPRPLRTALLCDVPDEFAPRVSAEVNKLAVFFAQPVILHNEQATCSALRAQAPAADVLHLACHGHFRPDNPLFSSLKMADGWFTVRDAAALPLQAELVTLSACETGVNAIAPGDEIIGLARGFFAAGVPALVLSLWTVDDDATAELMMKFYQGLQSGLTTAAALRDAQCAMLKQYPHPFFWSPFILLGR